MTERDLRELYLRAMIDVVGSYPGSAEQQPLNPLMIRFAQLVAQAIRKIDGIDK